MVCYGIYPRQINQTPNTIVFYLGSQTVGAKLHGRKGNSPDHNLRSLNQAKCVKEVRSR